MAAPFSLSFSDIPGLGRDECPGFPADDCPEELPDLSRHFSIVADILKTEPDIYHSLRNTRTPLGVSLAKCIKTGIDNRGHPMIKAMGLVAGDEYCYDVFRPLFDKVIGSRNSQSASSAKPPAPKYSNDTFEGYVVSAQVRASRNLKGLRFPPAISSEERAEVERVLVRALLDLEGPLKGDYYPLVGSQTYVPKPGGMSQEEEKALADDGLLFYHPDSNAILCSGAGRDWPDARGVFVNEARTIAVWINEEEHLRVMSLRSGSESVSLCFKELMDLLNGVEASLQHADCPGGFARSERLGYLNTSPANVGTAMRVSIVVSAPLLKPMKAELDEWSKVWRVIVRPAVDDAGVRQLNFLEISNRERSGVTEDETLRIIEQAAADLIRAEKLMERGAAVTEALLPTNATEIILGDWGEEIAWDAAGATLAALISDAAVSADAELKGLPASDMPTTSTESEELSRIRSQVANVLLVSEMSSALDDQLFELMKARAAVKIQAISRGSIVRKDDKCTIRKQAIARAKKQQEDSAAAKIQAIQRGKAQRKEVEARKKQQAQAHRDELRALFEVALEDGSLQAAVAEAKDIKQKNELRSIFEGALEDGSLEFAVAASSAVREPIDELRVKLATTLEVALQNGSLEAAIQSIYTSKEDIVVGSFAKDTHQGIRGKVLARTTTDILLKTEDGKEVWCEVENIQKDSSMPSEEIVVGSLVKDTHQGISGKVLARTTTDILLQTEDGKEFWCEVENILKDPNLERQRELLRKALKESALDGRLESALNEIYTERDAASQLSIEEIRVKLAKKLEESALDGRLEAALDEMFAERAATSTTALDEIRAKMAQKLEAALADGSLEHALETALKAKQPQNEEDLRKHVANRLQAALEDGSLEKALKASFEAKEQTNTDLDKLRQRMARELEASLANGSLEKALESALQARREAQEASLENGSLERALEVALEAKQAPIDLDDLRDRMARQLEASLEDGSLEKALESALQETQPAVNLDELRERMARQLEASLEDGSLEKALESALQAKSQNIDFESLRSKLAQRLEAALDDGSLEAALDEVKGKQSDIDSLRTKVATQLEASLEDGSLERALATALEARKPSQLDELKVKLSKQLEAAALDGRLTKALSESDAKAKLDKNPEFSVTKTTPITPPTKDSFAPRNLSKDFAAVEATPQLVPKAPSAPPSGTRAPRPIFGLPKVASLPTSPTLAALNTALSLMKVVSNYDRRIGLLAATIQEAERQLADKSSFVERLQVDICLARHDAECLKLEVENCNQTIVQEEMRELKLKESHKRLVDDMDSEMLKLRHAAVDMDHNMWATRSDLSTACTLNDMYSPLAVTREVPAIGDMSLTSTPRIK